VVSPAAKDPAAVLVVLARLEALRAFTSLLGSAGLDPGLVGIGALPLARLLPRGDKGQPPAALCLVDVGRLVTDLVVVRGGSPVFLRSFRAGAEEITRAIARALNVPRAQAEALKVGQLGFPDPAAISFTPPPDGALLAAAETGLGALLAPLRRTLLELRGRAVLGNDPLRILLTGGGSRIPGLAAAVAARLVVPVERLADAPLRVRGVPPEAVPAFGRAIGIALDHAAPRSQRVDLRKGEVRYRGDTAALRSRARVVAAGLGLVFFAWVFSAWAHDRALDAEAGRQRAALERATTAVMGRKYSDFDAVRSLLGKSSKPAEGPLPKADVLDILADLARSVPAEIRHSLTSLTIQPGKLEMNGLTRNAEEAARIPKMLKPDRSRETDRSKGPSPLEECVRDVGTLSGSGSEGNYTYQIEATTVCP
jgi:hypothetical protein